MQAENTLDAAPSSTKRALSENSEVDPTPPNPRLNLHRAKQPRLSMEEQLYWGVLVSQNPNYENVVLSKNYPEGNAGYTLGRHRDCDIVFSSTVISNRHCTIYRTHEFVPGQEEGEESVYIEDTSTNGTFLNGNKVGRNKRHRLKTGDEIQLDANEKFFIFRAPQRPPTVAQSFEDQYTTMRSLGSGNFAEVKLVAHKASGQKYAVKIVDKAKFAAKPKVMISLEQEIGVLMSIRHPCVISIREVFDETKYVYIILELAKDGELFEHIVSKSKLSENETRLIFYQLFHALKSLHDCDIAHRDLKPENVLLADKETLHVKISDFGLAKIVGEDSFLKTLCGTPSYVAPEVLLPSTSRNYGKSVDLWSLGVMLYICLCGFPPFSDDLAPPNLQTQIKQGKYDFPSAYWDNISDEAVDLVKRLLTVDPNERATVEEAMSHPWIRMKIEEESPSNLPDPESFIKKLFEDQNNQNKGI